MFDKRLIKELKRIKSFFMMESAAALVAAFLAAGQAFLLAYVVNAVLVSHNGISQIMIQLCMLAFLICIRALLNHGIDYYSRRCAIRIKFEMKREYLDAITKLGPVKIRDQKEGRLVSIGEDGIEAFDAFYAEFIPQMITVGIALPVLLVIAFLVDIPSALIMLFTAPLIPVFMMLIGKMADYFNKRQWKSLVRMSGHFLDVLKGLPTLRLFGRSKVQAEVVKRISDNFRDGTIGVLKISFLSALVLELVATISTAILSVTLGVRLIYGQVSFQHAFFILLLAPEYYLPLRQLGAKFHAAMSAKASADNVYEFVGSGAEIMNGASGVNRANVAGHVDDADCRSVEGRQCRNTTSENSNIDKHCFMEVQGLAYSYGSEVDVLVAVSFHLEKGQKIALVGPSGGGKSTIASILMGFLSDYRGEVKINGAELSSIGTGWTERYAYVPQHPKLFKDTIANNIAMANPQIGRDRIAEAAKQVGLEELISSMPDGYDTMVGDGGIKLSGGQIQLIAIARAYLKGAELVILDEPTSSLDVETEKAVNTTLDRLLKDKTVITIAHRLSTIIRSDRILVVESGSVVEQGSHQELVQNDGAYMRLLTAQEGGI